MVGFGFGFGNGVGTKLDHQPSAAFGEQREAIEVEAFASVGVDDDVVETFEADGAVFHDLRNVVSANANVGPSDYTQHARGRALHESAGGFENRRAGAFGADQRTRDVESIFGEQVIEVVTGDAARNVRILAADLVSVAVGELLQAGVDLGAAPAFVHDTAKIFFAGCAHVQALAVVGQDFERLDVVVRFARHDRVHAAGVVADHASEGAAAMGGGVGREGQVMLLGGGADVVEDYSRLHAGNPALGIDLEDIRHVLREIEDDRHVAALAGQGSSAAASEERSVMVAAEGDGGEHVFFVARNDYADRDLAIVGAVGRVERASAGVEADLSAEMAVEGG